MSPLSIYIHWPFCLSKCPYCDFNSRVAEGVDAAVFAQGYERELEHYAAQLSPREVRTIYFGGGTPSLMPPKMVGAILEKIAALWAVSDDVEVTLEANPTSSEVEKFKMFRAAGVNRLSLGVQALDDDALRFLGRQHDVKGAKNAIAWAAEIFPRFSFDLIYARAGQTPEAWRRELEEALTFGAKHLSLYQLTIEEGSVFYKKRQQENLTADEETAATMLEETRSIMARRGMPAYEISNYAVVGEESRHNLTYWHYDDYLGIGPGAHGRCVFQEERRGMENHRAPEAWLKAVAEYGHGRCGDEILDLETAQREALLMGLRLTTGIELARWKEKFGLDFLKAEKRKPLEKEGLLICDDRFLRTTEEGAARLNAILSYLI